MADDFFAKKRPWSKYKDLILGYYLEPYIPKVVKLRKPVLIVDCFAGRGRFDDGEQGSPLIIANAIQRWSEKFPAAAIRGLFVEAVPENFEQLTANLAPFGEIVTLRHGRFEEHLPYVARLAAQNTVFLYVDPYNLKGLCFDEMRHVYEQIRKASSSVELLLNLNAVDFMRWALAAVQRIDDWLVSRGFVEFEGFEDLYTSAEPRELSAIAGGDYWRAIANDESTEFPEKVVAFSDRYEQLLRRSFQHVCSYPVKERYAHKIPKYMLVYGTRHADGLELMNNAMCTAREEFLRIEFQEGRFLDMTPEVEIPNLDELDRELIEQVATRRTMTRKELRLAILPQWLGKLKTGDIDRRIGELLKTNRLYSSTGRPRINDTVQLRTQPFKPASG